MPSDNQDGIKYRFGVVDMTLPGIEPWAYMDH